MKEGIKLGLIPMGKFAFSHKDAKRYKCKIEKILNKLDINYENIDDVLKDKDGIVRSYNDVCQVVKYLKSKEVDGIFLPHCNFGTENAAGKIAKQMDIPTLLWGPRDEAPLPDGTRLRDSLCGLFATSKILKKFNVPFTYIENCEVEDPKFTKGLSEFIRTVNIVKKFRDLKIGIIGNRIDFFWSTIINENELLKKFGIEIQPFDLIKIAKKTKEFANKNINKYKEEFFKLNQKIKIEKMEEEAVFNMFALSDVMLLLANKHDISAFAVESFMSLAEELDAMISFALARTSDNGIPAVTESDIHGAISSVLLEAAGLNKEPSFVADLTIRHPENDNGVLLWHDSFPLSLKDPDVNGSLGPHWILDINPGSCHWKIKDGEITITRFDGEHGKYSLIAEKAESIVGPYTLNNYLWVEIEDWPRVERKFIEGPYIHHVACNYGDYVSVLKESCKYIEGLEFDQIY